MLVRVCRLALLFFCLTSLATFPAIAQDKTAAPPDTAKFRNPGLTAEERAADLLPRLTLEEKVAQISGGWEAHADILDTTRTYTTEQARAIFERWWDPELSFP